MLKQTTTTAEDVAYQIYKYIYIDYIYIYMYVYILYIIHFMPVNIFKCDGAVDCNLKCPFLLHINNFP